MTDAPKIETQAPERVWITSERCLWPTHRSFTASDLDHSNDDGTSDYPEYVRADVAAAREAAAWIAGRDAAAERVALLGKVVDADSPVGRTTDRCLRAARSATPLSDTTALDRLIAERVREAVEAEREACAKVAGDLSTQWWSECKRVFDHHLEGKSDGADDIANAIRARSESNSHNNSKVVE